MKYEFYTILKEYEDYDHLANWLREYGLDDESTNIEELNPIYLDVEIQSNLIKCQSFNQKVIDDCISIEVAYATRNVIKIVFEAPQGYASIFKLTFNTTSIDNIIKDIMQGLKKVGIKFKKKQNLSIEEWIASQEYEALTGKVIEW